MTFIISAATKNIALQVSDTRITKASDGSLVCDKSVKMTVAHCWDAKLIMSFTGLASIRGQQVSDWIEDKLVNFGARNRTFVEVLDHIKAETTFAAQLEQIPPDTGQRV